VHQVASVYKTLHLTLSTLQTRVQEGFVVYLNLKSQREPWQDKRWKFVAKAYKNSVLILKYKELKMLLGRFFFTWQ